MKLENQNNGSSTFLTGAILLANFDYSGMMDYAIKAAIGGAIWMTFRLTADYISMKLKTPKDERK